MSGFLTRWLFYGVIISGELLGIITLLTIFALAKGPVRTSLFIAIGLAAVYYLTIPPPVTNWFLYQGTPAPPAMLVNWFNVLKLGVHSWFHPGGPFRPFSTLPVFVRAVVIRSLRDQVVGSARRGVLGAAAGRRRT